jgi:hypothetical protein
MSYFRQPVFFTNGKTTAFMGATTEGNFNTVCWYLLKFLTQRSCKTTKNILSNQQTFPLRQDFIGIQFGIKILKFSTRELFMLL